MSRAAIAAATRRWTAERHPSGEGVARAVYGVIASGSVLAAEGAAHETHLATAGSAALAAAILWLAHSYTSLLGQRLATRGRLTAGELYGELIRESSILAGALIPIIALLCAWAAGAAQETAIAIAVWSSVGGVIVLELVAGIRSHVTRVELALQTGVGIAMGIAILALKAVLH